MGDGNSSHSEDLFGSDAESGGGNTVDQAASSSLLRQIGDEAEPEPVQAADGAEPRADTAPADTNSDGIDSDDLFGESGDEGVPSPETAALPPAHLSLPRRENAPADEKLYFVRLPNFLNIEPSLFDPNTYDGDHSGASVGDAATIRFRRAPDGSIESNARIVEWEDGSCHLFVGGETLDVVVQRTGAEDCQQLYYRHVEGESDEIGAVLECRGVVNDKMLFKPPSRDSTVHKRMKTAITQSYSKDRGVKIYLAKEDPEVQRERLAEEEAKRARAKLREESKRRNIANKMQLSQSYLEEGYEGDVSLGAIKASFRNRSLEEIEEEERAREQRILAAKRNSTGGESSHRGERAGERSGDDRDAVGATLDTIDVSDTRAGASHTSAEDVQGSAAAVATAAEGKVEEDGARNDDVDEEEDGDGLAAHAPRAKRRRADIVESDDEDA